MLIYFARNKSDVKKVINQLIYINTQLFKHLKYIKIIFFRLVIINLVFQSLNKFQQEKMAKKYLKETFTIQESYVNLSQAGPKIVKELLDPLRTDLAKDKDYNGATKIQLYIKFSNELVLKIFLSYLSEQKQFRFSKKTASEEDSIQLVLEKLSHLKQYYQTNKKEIQSIDQSSLAQSIGKLSKKYLYLSNVNIDNIQTQSFEDQNQSHIALAVLKYDKNIILAALKRTPKVKQPLPKPQQPQEIGNRSNSLKKAIYATNAFLFALIVLFLMRFYPVAHKYGLL